VLHAWISSDNPDQAALAGVLNQIIDGDRAPRLGTEFNTSSNRAIVRTVLQYAGSGLGTTT
jgi:hypothetical protein